MRITKLNLINYFRNITVDFIDITLDAATNLDTIKLNKLLKLNTTYLLNNNYVVEEDLL